LKDNLINKHLKRSFKV